MFKRGEIRRHVLPLVAVVAMPMGAHASLSASVTRPTPASIASQRVAALLKHPSTQRVDGIMHRLRSSHTGSLRGALRMAERSGQRPASVPHAVGHAKSNTSGSDLALPSDVITAGNGTQGLVSSGQGPFKVFHSSWSGYQSGVAASFNFEPIMDLFYQGSVFNTASSAQTYMNGAVTHLSSGNSVPPRDCTGDVGHPCTIIAYETTSGLVAIYEVAQVNYCTIETGYQGDPDQIQANLDDVSKLAADTFVLGVTEAEAACAAGTPNPQPTARPTAIAQPTAHPTSVPQPTATQVPTTFQVVGCFQKGGTHASANPTCLHKARHGQKVQLEVYTLVQSGPAGSTGKVSLSIKRGGTSVRSESGSFTTEVGTNMYPLGDSWKVPKKKGTYSLHAATTMNGVTESDDETLKVT